VPEVELELDISAAAERVWRAVLDIEKYPESMANVRSVRIIDVDGPTRRRSAWSVTLKGSILEWTESEYLDHENRRMTFHQLTGDLEVFEGQWVVEETAPELTTVRFSVSFEIGIPLLAQMLNPVAQRALRDNCAEMLWGIEREAAA
jgi:ribosome-associated toxin RatA of RatAB toxin-antitoxin module